MVKQLIFMEQLICHGKVWKNMIKHGNCSIWYENLKHEPNENQGCKAHFVHNIFQCSYECNAKSDWIRSKICDDISCDIPLQTQYPNDALLPIG